MGADHANHTGVEKMSGKYFKPKSLTWWSSFVPLVAGLTIATLPLHGWAGGVAAINAVTDGMSAAMLINLGLAGIGLRGAIE